MRVAIAIHRSDLEKVLETYNVLSRGLYTHASPIICNAGTVKPNFASCYIFQPDTSSTLVPLRDVAELDSLWQSGGGIGMSFADIPARRCVGLSSASLSSGAQLCVEQDRH